MFAELVIIFSLVVIVLIMSNLNFNKINPIYSNLFAVVGVRITPSISKIINSFNFKNCQPSLEVTPNNLAQTKIYLKLKKKNMILKTILFLKM